ncbi:hypothetical protein [Uliginosibacterium aquaticum]|uniref:Concanavalin A-like lectin/glucanases superfamily protein n=1 Tax=Uliginosibacterium aquaticum TaxID=2731212 RepID=A0ABX2II98_9RHOO|nr:hypothetical protein [Uliginosibacterium aquaticum]NSL53805.1 hypothetical protein [Uliginosibacterium aquaticum]
MTSSVSASSAASSALSNSSSSSSSSSSFPSGWAVYSADKLPTAAGSITLAGGTAGQFNLCASAGCNASYASVSSGILTVDTTTETAITEQSYFQLDNAFKTGGYPKSATVIARMRGNSVTNLKGLTIDTAFSEPGESGPRVHLVLLPNNHSTGMYAGALDQSLTGDQNVYSSDFDTTVYHTYQLSVTFTSATAGTVRVYLDGAATPILEKTLSNLKQATAVGQNYLRIGEENTSEHAKGDFDWVIWSSDAAYTPAQLAGALPAVLGPVSGYMGWNTYTADLFPTATGSITLAGGSASQFNLCASAGCNASYASVAGGILTVDTTAETAVTEQSYFQLDNAFKTGAYPKSATLIARMRGNSVTNLKGLTIDTAFSQTGASGPRVQLQLLPDNHSTGMYAGALDQSVTGDQNVYSSDFDTTVYHTYQLSVTFTSATAGTVRVYLDGAATPILEKTLSNLKQATAVGQNYLRIGEETTSEHAKGDIDWVIWTNEAAYTPAQVSGLLPAALGSISGY